MRRKIAKRYKKKLRALGCEIRDPHFVSEPGWRRKDCGYSAEIIFKNMHVCSCGKDELECYKMAYECVMDEIREPILTKDSRQAYVLGSVHY